ncbi:MAG: hypothetical protein PHZ00_03550 [Candidatus Peribacteraceae bacterium]|nr:hypothetical protein [Candidatus Peribacteraceae bacterium]
MAPFERYKVMYVADYGPEKEPHECGLNAERSTPDEALAVAEALMHRTGMQFRAVLVLDTKLAQAKMLIGHLSDCNATLENKKHPSVYCDDKREPQEVGALSL